MSTVQQHKHWTMDIHVASRSHVHAAQYLRLFITFLPRDFSLGVEGAAWGSFTVKSSLVKPHTKFTKH
jgi:hypothetical protein